MCTAEEKVFEALLCWVDYDKGTRKKALDRLLPLIRMALMDTVYLQDYVEGNVLLHGNKKAERLLTEAYKYQASPAYRQKALMSHQTTKRVTPPAAGAYLQLNGGSMTPAVQEGSVRYTSLPVTPYGSAAPPGMFAGEYEHRAGGAGERSPYRYPVMWLTTRRPTLCRSLVCAYA